MTLKSDLFNVTERIISARRNLAQCEIRRLAYRTGVARVESTLTIARNAAMADPAAGTNDHQRRAYADEQTARLRAALFAEECAAAAVDEELIRAQLALRIAEDERRYLELVAKLAIAGVGDAAGEPMETEYAVEDAFVA